MIAWTAHPILLAGAAGLFTWGMTAAGAAVVLAGSKPPSRRLLDAMLGAAAGVMIAASYWSLLAPALEGAADWGRLAFVPVAAGLLAGAGVLRLIDMLLPHIHPVSNEADGPPSRLPRSFLLILAITMHNIPEGLAVGVSMGATQFPGSDVDLTAAVTLALGIGLQNLPEGLAVAVPLVREGYSKRRAFFFGQLSGLVEPAAAVIGAAAVGMAQPLLPFTLAFAAGAMLFVVVEEVIPEAQASGHSDAATTGAILGFTVMMCLDVGLG